MAIAVVATLARPGDRQLLADRRSAIAVGTVIGAVSARTVKMTAMPQMVALFNGVGGGAAALIALVGVPPTGPRSPGTVDGRRSRSRSCSRR